MQGFLVSNAIVKYPFYVAKWYVSNFTKWNDGNSSIWFLQKSTKENWWGRRKEQGKKAEPSQHVIFWSAFALPTWVADRRAGSYGKLGYKSKFPMWENIAGCQEHAISCWIASVSSISPVFSVNIPQLKIHYVSTFIIGRLVAVWSLFPKL